MSDIFLSYASEDRERVRPLAEALTQEGWSVFWDRIIPVGKTWHELLEEELSAARSLLVVWSENSIKSKWVRAEANEGFRMELPLFPILLDPVLPPLGFRDIQAADFSTWDGSIESAVFQNLARDIKKSLSPTPTPKPTKPVTVEPATPEPVILEPRLAEVKYPEPRKRSRVGLIGKTTIGIICVLLFFAGLVYYFWEGRQVGRRKSIPKEPQNYGWLIVDTEPKDALVRILDIRPKFVQGMRLEPGKYKVKVSADGYKTDERWIRLKAGEHKKVIFKLVKIKQFQGITNSLGMKFVLIPAGTFMMGSAISPEEVVKRYDSEKFIGVFKHEHSRHQVTISQPFFLQTTEVTQGQWQKVMGNNPSDFKKCGKYCPVEQVSLLDAEKFIKKLNWMEKTNKYRLPTEAEWEYACRAGSTTRFSFGDDYAKLSQNAWYGKNSRHETHPVGKLKPNAWGLYDMHGNVWEWCQDRFRDYPATNIPVRDPRGHPHGKIGVLRGGSSRHFGGMLRSAVRVGRGPAKRDQGFAFIGFRVARDK